MSKHVVTIGQTASFVSSMMVVLLMGNKNAAGWMSQAAPLLQQR